MQDIKVGGDKRLGGQSGNTVAWIYQKRGHWTCKRIENDGFERSVGGRLPGFIPLSPVEHTEEERVKMAGCVMMPFPRLGK